MFRKFSKENHLVIKKLLLGAFKPRKELKKQYLKYIQNKDLPIDDRWEIFKAAPLEFKENEPWIQSFDIEDKIGAFPWFELWGSNRNETINLIEFIDGIEFDDETGLSDLFGIDEQFSVELLNEFKEEILQKNLVSFDLDW